MSSFILCYRPRRPVLTVVSCFCLMSSICFLSVFMLSHCCLVSSTVSFLVLCLQFVVVLIRWSWCLSLLVSSSSCLRLCPLVSPLCLVPVLCCPPVVLCCPLLSSCCPITTIIVPSCLLYHLVSFMSSVVVCVLSCLPSCYVLSRPLLSLFCPSSCRPVTVWDRHFSPADPRPQQNTY